MAVSADFIIQAYIDLVLTMLNGQACIPFSKFHPVGLYAPIQSGGVASGQILPCHSCLSESKYLALFFASSLRTFSNLVWVQCHGFITIHDPRLAKHGKASTAVGVDQLNG